MKKSSSNQYLSVIVVGNRTDGFVRYVMDLLSDYGIEFVRCDDVYSAVGRLAKDTRGDILVVGRLEQLSREQGRLFHITSKNGGTCCCLADTGSAQKYLQALAAIETEAFVINEPEEIKELITRLFAGTLARSPRKKENNKASAFNKEDFLTTKAEMDALLGG